MLQWLDTLIGLVVILLAASLVVMILTQIIVMVLSLRGYNLRNSITILLANLDPNLEKSAKAISEKVLQHPLITDKWGEFKRWGLATSIRKDELKEILEKLTKTGNKDWKNLLEQSLTNLKPEIDAWFERVMDRSSQAFVRQIRFWTIIFSFIVAFIFHLDIISMFEQISSDSELRANLIITSETIVNKADDIIGKSSNVPAIYVEAITKLKMQDTTGEAERIDNPPFFSSREEGEEWLRNQLAGSDYTDSLISRYRNIISSSLQNSLDEMKDYAYSIKSDLDKAGLKIVPQPYPGFFKYSIDKHFWGVLIMAAFLSLGAPFWFNALKTLSNLRPILATKEDKEKKDTKTKEGDDPNK